MRSSRTGQSCCGAGRRSMMAMMQMMMSMGVGPAGRQAADSPTSPTKRSQGTPRRARECSVGQRPFAVRLPRRIP
jgi:hypothetical protein